MPRHKPTLRQKLDTALLQLGLDPEKGVRLDHTIPLALRERTPDGGYIPAENDPRFLQWLSTEAHSIKTSGRHGTSGTVVSGDIHKIAKAKRLAKAHDPELAAAAVLSKAAKTRWPQGRGLRSRGFEKRGRLP